MISQQVKVIGSNGQLSLGKEFAGKMVLIDQLDNGTWIIKAGKFIPETEQWLYEESNLIKLNRALEWTSQNIPIDNFEASVNSSFDKSL